MHNEISRRRRVRWAALAAVLVMAVSSLAAAQPSRDVLVLDAGAAGRPVSNAATAALSAAFETCGTNRPHLYHEWLDQDRFPAPGQMETVVRYLVRKYHRWRRISRSFRRAAGPGPGRIDASRSRDWTAALHVPTRSTCCSTGCRHLAPESCHTPEHRPTTAAGCVRPRLPDPMKVFYNGRIGT